MGLFLSTLSSLYSDWMQGGRPMRILLLGLDAAGKTTILYKVKLNEQISTIPTIGFNVEEITPVKGLTFVMWDVGGQVKLRPLWRHYFQDTQGVVFVVDSSDRDRVEEARVELFSILEDDRMRGVPVVVLANKQDLPNAMSPGELVEKLQLRKLSQQWRTLWHVQAAVATSGDGLIEGMTEMGRLAKEFQRNSTRS